MRDRRNLRPALLGVVLLCSLPAVPLAAQDFLYMAPETTVTYAPGSGPVPTFTVDFQIWQFDGGVDHLTQGFTMGVTHPDADLDAVAVDYGGALLSDDWGQPDFFSTDTYDDGWTCGVVYSFYGGWTVAFPDPAPAITVTYAADASILSDPDGRISALTFSDGLGMPTVTNTIVVGGASHAPMFSHGSVVLRPKTFVRGDMNSDGQIDIADVFTAEDYLFVSGAEPSCLAALDSNDDDLVNIADIIHLLGYLFIAGEAPATPFPLCGGEPGDSPFPCDASPCP